MLLFDRFICLGYISSVKYQAKPSIIYTSTKSEESFVAALQQNGMVLSILLKYEPLSLWSCIISLFLQTELTRLPWWSWSRAQHSATSKRGTGTDSVISSIFTLFVCFWLVILHDEFPMKNWSSRKLVPAVSVSVSWLNCNSLLDLWYFYYTCCFTLIVISILCRLVYLRVTGMDDGLNIKERICYVSFSEGNVNPFLLRILIIWLLYSAVGISIIM